MPATVAGMNFLVNNLEDCLTANSMVTSLAYMMVCDGVYKPHTRPEGAKRQFWAQVAHASGPAEHAPAGGMG